MLLFKKKFIDLIRSGVKTQTIRLWKHRQMKQGQRSYIPGIGYITISGVQEVALNELKDSDAVPDGFATADALRKELHSLYAERIQQGFRAFRIGFRVLSPQEQERVKEEKAQKNQAKIRNTTEDASAVFVETKLEKLKQLANA
jgi:hypothetical protein